MHWDCRQHGEDDRHSCDQRPRHQAHAQGTSHATGPGYCTLLPSELIMGLRQGWGRSTDHVTHGTIRHGTNVARGSGSDIRSSQIWLVAALWRDVISTHVASAGALQFQQSWVCLIRSAIMKVPRKLLASSALVRRPAQLSAWQCSTATASATAIDPHYSSRCVHHECPRSRCKRCSCFYVAASAVLVPLGTLDRAHTCTRYEPALFPTNVSVPTSLPTACSPLQSERGCRVPLTTHSTRFPTQVPHTYFPEQPA